MDKEEKVTQEQNLAECKAMELANPRNAAAEVRNDPVLFNFKLSVVTGVIFKLHDKNSAHAHLMTMAEKTHTLPDGRKVHYSLKTYERWVRDYRESNEDPASLDVHVRRDKGYSRKLTAVVMERISELVRLAPSTRASGAFAIRRRLIKENLLPNEEAVSLETIRRFIRSNALRRQVETEERIRHEFIMPNVGDMWQADTCYYFKIYVEKLKKWVYIQGIMDDHSRFIVAARCYDEDSAENFRKTLLYAISHHHIPRMLVVDNGGPYVDFNLRDVCKRLGIALVHTRACDGASKGAVERWWKTTQSATMLDLVLDNPKTVDDVQKIVDDWVADYHKKVNSGVAGSPLDRYLASIARHPVRKPESYEWLKEQFYCVRERYVKCSRISVDNIKFRVPDELAREKKLKVRFDSEDIRGTIYTVVNNKRYALEENDLVANSKEKRNTGGRMAQLKEKAAAKEAERKAKTESASELFFTEDAKSVEKRRAETRYAQRTAGTPLQSSSEAANSDSEKAESSGIGGLDFSTF